MTLEFIFFFFPFSQFLHILPCFCFVHAINPCGVSRPGAPFSWFYYKWYDETLGSIYDDLVDETLWARILIFRRRPAFISLMAQVALLSPFFYLSTLQTIGIDGLDIHLSQATLPTFCKLFFSPWRPIGYCFDLLRQKQRWKIPHICLARLLPFSQEQVHSQQRYWMESSKLIRMDTLVTGQIACILSHTSRTKQ